MTTRSVSNAERNLTSITTDKRLIETYSIPFLSLRKAGVFAEEDRLLWSETLKHISEKRKLPDLRYSISPQSSITNIGPGFSPQLILQESTMEIVAGLGHEGDFIEIIRALSELPGILRVQECQLEKSRTIEISTDTKNVELYCTLAWFTFSQNSTSEVNALATADDVGEPI